MKIRFKVDVKTASYGDVQAGDTKTVSKADGDGYIKNKLAKKATKETEVK